MISGLHTGTATLKDPSEQSIGWNLISLIFSVAENSPPPPTPVGDQDLEYQSIGSYLESICHKYSYFYSFYLISLGWEDEELIFLLQSYFVSTLQPFQIVHSSCDHDAL